MWRDRCSIWVITTCLDIERDSNGLTRGVGTQLVAALVDLVVVDPALTANGV